MAIVTLHGFFSYIDKYNKLIFCYNDDKTFNILGNYCRSKKIPFNNKEFNVVLPKNNSKITDDIRAKVGYNCILTVKIIHYKFCSKFESNYGQTLSGDKLSLLNIQIMSLV